MTLEAQYAEIRAAVAEWWKIAGSQWPLRSLLCFHGRVVSTPAMQRAAARSVLDGDERLYRENGNALVIWAGVLEARNAAVALPPWIRHYLEGVACRLLAIARSNVARRRRPARVVEALGLRSQGPGRKQDAFDRFSDHDQLLAAMKFWQARASSSYEAARADVCKAVGMNERNVERAWRKYRDVVVPPHLRSVRARRRS